MINAMMLVDMDGDGCLCMMHDIDDDGGEK